MSEQTSSIRSLDDTLLVVKDKVTCGCRFGGSTAGEQSLQLVRRQATESDLGKLEDLIGVGLIVVAKETQLLVDTTMIALDGLRGVGHLFVGGQQAGIAGGNIQLLDASLLHLLVGRHFGSSLTLLGMQIFQ